MIAPAQGGWRQETGSVLRRALHPPLRDRSFWVIQATVLVLATVHFFVDADFRLEDTVLPTGLPVALLFVPLLYATLRYGLMGSGLTAVVATLLWLPDLLLPDAHGHPADDAMNLIIIDAVAVFVGWHIDRELMQEQLAAAADRARDEADNRYHSLFDISFLPVLIVDRLGRISNANPAAAAIFGGDLLGETTVSRLSLDAGTIWSGGDEPVVSIDATDGTTHTYRLHIDALRPVNGDDAELRQVVFQDITPEHRERATTRAFAARMLAAQEEERHRIAREIHDDPLQRLIYLARRAGDADGGNGELRDGLLDAVTRLRDLARGLRPPGLDQLGLAAALRGMLAELERDEGIGIDLQVSGDARRLPPEVELTAFRIVQEAVRNATRHASARSLHVGLDFTGDALRVEIADDGIGFEPGTTSSDGTHFGLVGMRERAVLLGGHLTVASAPGSGTTVAAHLPVTHAAASTHLRS